MELSKINIDDLKYNPTDYDFVEKMELMEEFTPRLWPAKILERKKLFTYIVLMYDMNCNLRNLFPNYWNRKRVTAETAGFEIKEGQFPEAIENMLIGKIPACNAMVVRYLMLFNEPAYISLVSYYEMFIQEARSSLEESDSSSKKMQSANILFFNKNIKLLSDELFGGDETNGYRRELYKTAISEIISLRPEMIGDKLMDKNQPTGVFYENEEDIDA